MDDLNITQVMNVINLAKKSGTLRIRGEGDEQKAEIYFKDGQVLAARTRQRSRDLLEDLRHARKLSADKIAKLREKFSGEGDKRIAMQLVSGSYVTREGITEAIQHNTLELVEEIINWDRINYRFVDTLPDFSNRMIAPIDIERVITEAARLVREEARLKEQIPDLNLALGFSENASRNLREMTLTRDEWAVIGFAKPDNSLENIAEACNLTPTAIRRIVARLMEVGVLETVPRETPDPAEETSESRLSKVETQVMKLLNPNYRKKD